MGTVLWMEGLFLNYINVPAKKMKLIYISVICKTDMRKIITEKYISQGINNRLHVSSGFLEMKCESNQLQFQIAIKGTALGGKHF